MKLIISQEAKQAAAKIWRECGEHSDYLDVKQMEQIIQQCLDDQRELLEEDFWQSQREADEKRDL